MDILIYVPPYHIGSDIGGSHVHLTKLVKELNAQHDVTVICNSSAGFEDTSIEAHEVNSIDVPIFWRLSLTFSSLLALVSVLRNQEIDVVYTRNNYHSIVSRITSFIFSPAHVVEVNGFAPEEQGLDPRNSMRELITFCIWRFIEWSFRFSDHIITVTNDIKDKLESRHNIPADRMTVINNGADIDTFRPRDPVDSRSELGLDLDANYLCFVGRLTRWQGVEYLIEAVPQVVEADSTTELLIVGDGPLRETLADRTAELGIDDRVHFIGRVPHEDVPVYIGASDVCIVYKEPLESGYSPLKLYEYLACGRPVVASDVSGFEVLEEINAGVTAKPNDSAALAEAIVEVIEGDSDAMGTNGREYVERNHSWEKVAEKVAAVCRKAVAK